RRASRTRAARDKPLMRPRQSGSSCSSQRQAVRVSAHFRAELQDPLSGLRLKTSDSPHCRDFADVALWRIRVAARDGIVNSTYFGLLAEFGEANIPLERVAPKYFGLSFEEARRRAPGKVLPCRAFRLGGQKSPWLVSAADLAELIDERRERAG